MKKTIAHSSRVISGITLLSRITGLLRDVVIASWLGNSWIQDRLSYAFAIPHMFRRLFGEGALSAAFIPVLSERLRKETNEEAGKLFGNVATLLAMTLAAITFVIMALLISIRIVSDGDIERNLTVGLTAVMFPYMIFVCLVALFSALLNCLERFGVPAFMPIILNIFQIAAVIFARSVLVKFDISRYHQVYAIGFGVLLGGIVQLGFIVLAVKRTGLKWGIDFSTDDPDLRRIIKMMLPMMLGLGVLQFGAWLDNQIILSLTAAENPTFTIFGHIVHYPMREGALSSVTFARRLYNLPLGVLGIALATAAFPAFSRYAADKNYPQLAESVTKAIKLSIFQGLPSGIGLMVLAELIVRVVFQRGNFNHYDTEQTALVLKLYSLGLWAYCAHHIILRGFYSLGDTITPLKVMSWTLCLNVLLNVTLLWIPSLQQGAFGLSTSIMATLNVIILGWILSKRVGGISLRKILYASLKTAGASFAMGITAYYVSRHAPIESKYLLLGTSMLAGAAVFFAVSYLLKIEEVRIHS